MKKIDSKSQAHPSWGGRFKKGPNAIMEQINASISFDKRLYLQDIQGSKAHANMLMKIGILSPQEGESIHQGLDQVLQEIEQNTFPFSTQLEDIHMNIESRLFDLIGLAGKKLHTARSRNDQVATDFKLWVRDVAIEQLDENLKDLQRSLIHQAQEHIETLLPGLTHLQAAQPVSLGHHFLAYVEMIGRDRSRLADGKKRLNECPLGSAALAGTPYAIDRHMTAKELGFDRPACNSLDAVSDRDFALEYLACASIIAIHLSRLSEELILWCSDAFEFIQLSDDFSTGSSIMPQKRNPDAAELIRAKSGRILGNMNSLFVTMKALPLAYSKDMQEDKEPVFQTHEHLDLCTQALTGMISTLSVNKEAMKKQCEKGFINATDLADWLVTDHNIPFRQAHHITGEAVKKAENQGIQLDELSLKDFQEIHPEIDESVYDVLKMTSCLQARRSFGGTCPDMVRQAIDEAKKRFLSPT